MKKKLLMLIGGSLLSAMFLAGCANDQDPPPDDDVDIENPADENGGMNGDNGNGDDMMDGNNGNGNGDVNTDTDGDMMEDDNTPGEEPIEDQKDMNDEDNQDQ